jgi:hypothetical protein
MRAFEFLFEQEPAEVDQERLSQRREFIMKKMAENPSIVDAIFKKLRLVDEPLPKKSRKKDADAASNQPSDDTINPRFYLQPAKTGDEQDYNTKAYFNKFVDVLQKAKGDVDDVENFLKSYGTVSFIDIKKLTTEGKTPISNIFLPAEGVSLEFIQDVFNGLFGETAKLRGPGEVALALLSPQITFASGGGDLQIGDIAVEVKGEAAKGGGRLKDSANSFGSPNLGTIYSQIPDLPEDLKLPSTAFTANAKPGKRKDGKDSVNIYDHAQRLESISPGTASAFYKEMMTKTYVKAADTYDTVFANLPTSREDAFSKIATMSFNNYKAELIGKTGAGGAAPFNHVLFISPTQSLFFALDNMQAQLGNFKFQSIDFSDKVHGPAVQVSLK